MKVNRKDSVKIEIIRGIVWKSKISSFISSVNLSCYLRFKNIENLFWPLFYYNLFSLIVSQLIKVQKLIILNGTNRILDWGYFLLLRWINKTYDNCRINFDSHIYRKMISGTFRERQI